MKISVFGTGYVGLVTGTCFAEMGNEVICADIDQNKIRKLREGLSPIYEPNLDNLIQENTKAGRLSFTTDLPEAVRASELLFIAVGTPPNEDGSADLRHVFAVAETIAENMNEYRLVVNKSTVPVGSGEKVKNVIKATLDRRNVSIDFDIVSNPEFLKEGTAIEDCLRPSRVIIGCQSSRARGLMQQLYEPFVRNGNPLHFMDLPSAEMTKYAANAMLATKISFMNELSRLCEKTGADIELVRQGIGSDPRIGHSFIYAGLGYGGSCFPKDVKALIDTSLHVGEEAKILRAVDATNLEQRKHFYQKIENHFCGNIRGKRFALWGLAFKPGTDDVRYAPALYLIERLIEGGASISAYDPVAAHTAKVALGQSGSAVAFCDEPYTALQDADALVIATEWKPFREPNFSKIKGSLKTPLIFDGRNLYDPNRMKEQGFSYYCVGR